MKAHKNFGVPETIEEDRKEEDLQPRYVRRSRFPEMRDHNEFGKRGKRFRSEEGLKKRHGYTRKPIQQDITSEIYSIPWAYVSETEEESASSDSCRRNKKKVKIMTLGHLSNLLNKKIFSDDFDKSSSFFSNHSRRKNRLKTTNSMIDDTIREENEIEFNNYLSDSSSNSQFSLRRRYMNLDLSKLIDKLEPLDDSSAVASKYYGNVNETIEEEGSDHSDELDKSNSRSHNSSHSSSLRDKLRHDMLPYYSSLYPFGLGKLQNPKSRSLIC